MARNRGKLNYHLALPVTVIIVLLLLVNIVLSSYLQRTQSEETMHNEAYILSQEMAAVWDFISINQDRINHDENGEYNFKGLHCSKVGLSVGALFSKRTDYIIRYAALNPRSEQNRADEFEEAAINSFNEDTSLEEYSGFAEINGEEDYFRYAAPLRMEENCEECHGRPVDEIDITGYPKEGFANGEIIGIISIATPTKQFETNYLEVALLHGIFLLFLSVGCIVAIYFYTQKYVTKPLGKLERAIEKAGSGNAYKQIDAEDIGAKGEIKSLVSYFNESSLKLESIHTGLESEVKKRTIDLEEANTLLVEQAQELESLNERLRVDNRYKSHYFTMMSHELKTPLTAIIAYANLLRESNEGDDDNSLNIDAVDSITSNSRALLKLIGNILESAKLEAGRADLELQAVDVDEVFNHLEASLNPLAAERNILLYFFRSQGVPLFIADPDKLAHVLENLASNAIKHTPHEGVVVIESYYFKKDETIRFRVIDDGPGISQGEQELIFKEFVQANEYMERPVSGSGLGLTLAKEYTELHQGSIELVSEVNKGSIFTVILPYKPVVSESDDTHD